MKNKISLLLSLTLLTLIPSSNPYTKKDLERLQSLASMGSLCSPIIKISERYIPVPQTNTYQQRRLVENSKRAIKHLGYAFTIMQPILAAATETDENLLSVIDACLLAALKTKPNLFSE